MNIKEFTIVVVNHEYCDYLRKFDNRVSYNSGVKELRPFVGVLFKIDNMEYYAPLSSPKPKHVGLHSNVDLIKIKDGLLGVINLNNMIPVTKNNYVLFDMDKRNKSLEEIKRIALIRKQLNWLNSKADVIMEKAFTLHFRYCENILPERIKSRCCNFPLLEEKCKEYNMEEKQ